MYKIYINGHELNLMSSSDKDSTVKEYPKAMVARYLGKTKMLLNYIDMMEKRNSPKHIIIHYKDFNKLKSDFKGLFTIIKAAGGLVINNKNKVLFIYRRNFWDLPKGKLDDQEKKRDAALREVKEETGADDLTLLEKITTTKHVYKNKSGVRIIKQTWWYLMKAPDQKLTPQTKEDITIAQWISLDYFKKNCKPVYENINDVIEAYEAMLP